MVSWALSVCSAEKMVSTDGDGAWVLYAVSSHLVCSAAGRDWPAVGLQLPGGRQPYLYRCERVGGEVEVEVGGWWWRGGSVCM